MATIINSSTSNGLVMTPDTSGEIELQANGVTKAKVTANGLQDANGNSLRGGSFRSLILNGDMQIAQRSTSVAGITGGSNYYTCDRFKTSITNGGTWTQTQSTDVPSGYGFANSLKLQCTTADTSLTSTDQIAIDTRLEGQNLQHLKYGTSSAEKLTLSFWVKSNKTGTQTFELQNVSGTFRSISSTYTIDAADTWEKKTITCDGDTVGTLDNDNTLAIVVKWWLGAGSSFTSGTLNTSWAAVATADRVSSSNVNLADSTSNYINITGIQLEVGSGASDFEFLPYDVQLARCQRYYWKPTASNSIFGSGYVVSSTRADMFTSLPVSMRASPSIVNTAVSIRINYAAVSVLATTINLLNSTTTGFGAYITGATGLTVGQGVTVSNNGILELSAEL